MPPVNLPSTSPASNSTSVNSGVTATASPATTGVTALPSHGVAHDEVTSHTSPIIQFASVIVPETNNPEDDSTETADLVNSYADILTTNSSAIPLASIGINDNNIVEIMEMLDARSLEHKIDNLILSQLYEEIEGNIDSTNLGDILKVIDDEIDVASSQITSARSFYMSLIKLEKSLDKTTFLNSTSEVVDINLKAVLRYTDEDLGMDFLDRLSKITGINRTTLEGYTLTNIYSVIIDNMKKLLTGLPHKFAMAIEQSLNDLPKLEEVGAGDDPYDGFVFGSSADKLTYYNTTKIEEIEKVMHTCILLSKEFQMSAGLGRMINTPLGLRFGVTGDYTKHLFGHSSIEGSEGKLMSLASAGVNGDTESTNVLLFENSTTSERQFDAVSVWVNSLKADPLNNLMGSYQNATEAAEQTMVGTEEFFSKLLLTDVVNKPLLTSSGLFLRILSEFSRMIRAAAGGDQQQILSLALLETAAAHQPKWNYAALGLVPLRPYVMRHLADYYVTQNEEPKLRMTSATFASGSFDAEDPVTIIDNLQGELFHHNAESAQEETGQSQEIAAQQATECPACENLLCLFLPIEWLESRISSLVSNQQQDT